MTTLLTPLPYQDKGIDFLRQRKRAYLADEMGLGKSMQLIRASQGDTLVVAPAMIVDSGTWTNEIEKWADDPDRFTLTAFSRINERDGRKLTAKPHPDFNRSWDTILIDEAHYLKNRDAKRTQAMMKIIKKADRVYLASGTPIPNWSHELFVPLQILRPDQAKPGGELGSYWRWVEKWFRVSESPFGHGSLDIGRLRGCTPACDRRGLDDPCAHYRRFVQGNMEDQFIRRLRDDVLQDLPALTTQEVRIPMKPKQWTEYRRMRREFIAEVGDTELVAWNTAARHTNLDKITTSLGMLAGGDPLTDSGKFDRLAADLAERTRPTIVVGHYRATVEAAAAVARSLGKKVRVIHGGTGNRERELTVKQFQQNKIDVLVGSYDTISEGLTLTAADTMILVETSYKAARNDQVIRRIHRIGQEHSCLVLDYISTGPAGQSTLDVSKRKLLAQKKKGIEHALSGSTIKEML